MRTEFRERNERGVGYEGDSLSVSNQGERLQICNLHLRIGDDFQIDATSITIHSTLHGPDVSQVTQSGGHSETRQRSGNERIGVTKQVA